MLDLIIHMFVLAYCAQELLKLRQKRIINKAVKEFDLSKLSKDVMINGQKLKAIDCSKLTVEQQDIMMKHIQGKIKEMDESDKE
jgi:hypothetical protein